MSGITGISVAARQIPQAMVAVAAAAGVAALSQGSGRDTAGPAVIMSLSSAATASAAKASPALRSMDPIAVGDALALVTGANGAAAIAAHFDEAYVASKIGTAFAERAKDDVTGYANVSAQVAMSAVRRLDLPVNDPAGSIVANLGPTGPAPASGTATSGYFTVSDFSFTNGGSIYSITTGASGMLTGTKDGQYWMALGMIPSDQPPSQPTAPLSPAQATAKALSEAADQAARLPMTYGIAEGTAGVVSPNSAATRSAASAGSSATSPNPTEVANAPDATSSAGYIAMPDAASSTVSSQASQLLTTGQSANLTSMTAAETGAQAALKTLTAYEAQRTLADTTATGQSLSSLNLLI